MANFRTIEINAMHDIDYLLQLLHDTGIGPGLQNRFAKIINIMVDSLLAEIEERDREIYLLKQRDLFSKDRFD